MKVRCVCGGGGGGGNVLKSIEVCCKAIQSIPCSRRLFVVVLFVFVFVVVFVFCF